MQTAEQSMYSRGPSSKGTGETSSRRGKSEKVQLDEVKKASSMVRDFDSDKDRIGRFINNICIYPRWHVRHEEVRSS